MPRVLGILGGMGPEATILLMTSILRATPAEDDSDHIPLLVDNNTQVPSRIAHLIGGTGPDPTPVLVDMAKRLEQMGAEALAMPCNTAHSYLPAIAEAIRIPVFDMVTMTAEQVDGFAPDGPVGILASPATRRTGIFTRAFERLGREVLYAADQDAMLAAIRLLKSGRMSDALPALNAAGKEIGARGAVALVIGCSEFSVAAPHIDQGLPTIDSLAVLTRACTTFALGRVAG